MKTWKVCCALVIPLLLADLAAAAAPPVNATPVAAGTASLTPYSTAICTYSCYCPKPMPCIGCPPCGGICVPYSCKPMPCITCPPCDGICVPYSCKPMPCLCNPLARPCDCYMPACFGAGR